ncbi:MAG TPA: MBL fold metallo-hydrolase [Parapedobacter sp.]|uniref:ComEC/Rec2 family competence protein n=1 Tax=Parapedobacter sp. TaxID=1958893 RepID=UPI002BD5B82D|nr:MBL fold metallo-hydrolase [Parapedobacter sp.]HWK56798.1 MBL fold metallo-hydrolase [Parapedobacter sp.]
MKTKLLDKVFMNRILLLLILVFFTLYTQAQRKSDFIMWQLPSQVNTIMNSYVFQMANGKVCVFDGGTNAETTYLRGFIGALGNEVEAWFVSHPHSDHIEALNEILENPNGIKIKTIYHSKLSNAFVNTYEIDSKDLTFTFYDNLVKSGINVIDIREPGYEVRISKTIFKILGVSNEEIIVNPYNNSSMVIKVADANKSILFLADLGREGGDKLLASPYARELDCDYLQLAHHGQSGVRKEFYRQIKFSACLWSTPSWLYDNDAGQGYNTHTWETVEIRELMKQLGIKKHYRSFEGLFVIE